MSTSPDTLHLVIHASKRGLLSVAGVVLLPWCLMLVMHIRASAPDSTASFWVVPHKGPCEGLKVDCAFKPTCQRDKTLLFAGLQLREYRKKASPHP